MAIICARVTDLIYIIRIRKTRNVICFKHYVVITKLAISNTHNANLTLLFENMFSALFFASLTESNQFCNTYYKIKISNCI